MSFCTDQILSLASGIYQSIGSPTAQSVGFISGWITSSGGMLGDINTKLDTCFYLSGSAPCIAGGFGDQEESFSYLLYQSSYYETKALSALAGLSTPWTTMKEGDTTIVRESSVNISKQFLAMHENAQQQIRLAIHDYKLNRQIPGTVDASDLYSYPSP